MSSGVVRRAARRSEMQIMFAVREGSLGRAWLTAGRDRRSARPALLTAVRNRRSGLPCTPPDHFGRPRLRPCVSLSVCLFEDARRTTSCAPFRINIAVAVWPAGLGGLDMDESATEEEAFYLEQVTLEDDEDDEFDYTEVVVEDDEDEGFGEDAAEDEDLEQALKTLKTREDGLPLVQVEAVPRSAITRRPEVLDDFIRNVLLKMGMVSAARECGQ